MGTDRRTFGSWRLRGGRYEQQGLPVEVLAEFARYERLVVDVARGLYKQRHATRQRVPRGFASSFSLRLSDIQAGSVVPILERATNETDTLFDEDSGIFDEARILIQDTLPGVLEDKHSVAQQAPALLRAVRDGSRGLPVGSHGRGARRVVRTHGARPLGWEVGPSSASYGAVGEHGSGTAEEGDLTCGTAP